MTHTRVYRNSSTKVSRFKWETNGRTDGRTDGRYYSNFIFAANAVGNCSVVCQQLRSCVSDSYNFRRIVVACKVAGDRTKLRAAAAETTTTTTTTMMRRASTPSLNP